MLGILKNGFRISSRPLFEFVQTFRIFKANSNCSPVAALSCQRCNITAPATRLFGTMRTLVSPNAWSGETDRLLSGGYSSTSRISEIAGFDSNWTMTSGGPYLVQCRGMKFKGRVKRRCKDCYLQWVNGMLYNLCKSRPRHKQGLKPAYFANQRILTHATMSPRRPW